MPLTGKYNALTDVPGILVGHHTDLEAASGVTVVLCVDDAVAGVDVRGSAPGTRETDLLNPLNLVEKVQAIALSGGSVYGLAAADGVVEWLAGKGRGVPLGQGFVAPIVPAATLFDLGRGSRFVPPIGRDWGLKACSAAKDGPVAMGSVGAGTGALSGGIKGGVGTASEIIDMEITVAALVAVNSYGSVIDPDSGLPWELRLELDGEFGPLAHRAVRGHSQDSDLLREHRQSNTTIGVVATDVVLTKAQAQKVAQMAHDGLARAIRPVHTMFDGDTIFCVATGKRDLPRIQGFFPAATAETLNRLGTSAANCMSRAVIRALVEAQSLAGMTALRDLAER